MKEICVLPDSVFRHFEEARSHSVTSMSSTYRCVRTISKMAACVVVGNACCMLQYMKLFRISPQIHKTKITNNNIYTGSAYHRGVFQSGPVTWIQIDYIKIKNYPNV